LLNLGDLTRAWPAIQPFCTHLMVETGHLPSWPQTEIRKPWNSSSQTFSTVPAFPSVRTTALPTRLDCTSPKAARIVDALFFTVDMVTSGSGAASHVCDSKAGKS
jgi:hypothetical protein